MGPVGSTDVPDADAVVIGAGPNGLVAANKLADAEIASEIYSTAGDFDLLVKFYVEDGTDIGHFVNEKVQTTPGIVDTRTIITFKAF